MKAKITKNMYLKEIIEKYPKTLSIFFKYNLHCATCPVAPKETLEQAVKNHHLDLEEVLKKLNQIIE